MAGYRRAISFPTPKTAVADGKLAAAYRVRSASLPCRFHPLVLQLDDDVATLRLVIGGGRTPSVSVAASQIGRVLASLSELLHHPQAQEPLRILGMSPLAERLLDDFLCLADAHGSFREALVALAGLQAQTRAALRRGNSARLASAVRAQRLAGRDLPRLAAAARSVAGKAPTALPEDLQPEAAALVGAIAAIASASAVIFSGVSSLNNATTSARVENASTSCCLTASSRSAGPTHDNVWCVADVVCWISRAKGRSGSKHSGGDKSTAQLALEERARKGALELHDNLERCIASVDSSGDMVFRALVNTRVSLLNILSPTI